MKKAYCILLAVGILFLSACSIPNIQPAAPSSSSISQPLEIVTNPENIGNPMECSFRLETVFDQREKEYYLYIPPTSSEDNILLLFDPDTNREIGSNTALLSLSTGELTRLPYTTENIQMDKDCFYWLGFRPKPDGGAYGQICTAQQESPEKIEILYETPEEWIQDTSLFYGDGFLVWGEYKVNEDTGNIECYRIMSFDLEKKESFEVATMTEYYGVSLYLSVNSGMISYGSNPIYGYSLKERKIIAEQPCDAAKSAAYDGTYLAYIEAFDNEQLILTMPGTSLKRILAKQVINVDIVKGEFVLYSTNSGFFIYSISKDDVVFQCESPSDEPGFNFGKWFHTDKETGTTLFKNIIKATTENGPATTVSALFMDFHTDK